MWTLNKDGDAVNTETSEIIFHTKSPPLYEVFETTWATIPAFQNLIKHKGFKKQDAAKAYIAKLVKKMNAEAK